MRAGIAAAAAASAIALPAALPGSAAAAPECLYQGGGTADAAKLERSLFCLTNLHRHRHGIPLLSIDTRLAKAARGHSDDMVARDYFSHVSPEGKGPFERSQAVGYPGGAGENIAALGTPFPLFLFDTWRGSDAHNANMLDPDFTAGGFGIAVRTPGGGPGITGTQMFGFTRANTGDTGMSFYASSRRCAKAKIGLIKLKQAKKAKKKKPRIRRAQRRIRSLCKPLA
jgi:uncharacterized protein YkwD